MRKSILRLTLWMAWLLPAVLVSSCGDSSKNTPLKPLADVYADIANNNQKMIDAMQAVYKAEKSEQDALMKKATSIADEVKTDNEKLAEKAEDLGNKLQGEQIDMESTEAAGYTVGVSTFENVNARPRLANILISTECVNGVVPKSAYCLFLDSKGNVITKNIGLVSDDKRIAINCRITTDKGPQTAELYAKLSKIVFVSQAEYNAGAVSSSTASATEDVASSEQAVVEPDVETDAEPEPAYIGEETDNTPNPPVISEGVTFVKGANLKETLAKAKKIDWEYNADMGVGATIGKVFVTIPEDDLTQKGQDVVNALASDIEIGIPFSMDYIKPTAKLQIFEVNE